MYFRFIRQFLNVGYVNNRFIASYRMVLENPHKRAMNNSHSRTTARNGRSGDSTSGGRARCEQVLRFFVDATP